MTVRRCMIAWLVILASVSLFTGAAAQPAAPQYGANPAKEVPWVIQNAYPRGPDDAGQVTVAYGGTHKYPVISITDGEPIGNYVSTQFVFPEVGMVGDCGSGGNWVCMPISTDFSATAKSSRMAVHKFTNSFKVSWLVNERDSDLMTLNTYELTDDLVLTSTEPMVQIVVDFAVFPAAGNNWLHSYSIPSLVFDDAGNPHMAFSVVAGGGEVSIVYAHRLPPAEVTSPCNDIPGTRFQCDIIFSSSLVGGAPVSIVLSSTGAPRISYVNYETDSLMIAYPASGIQMPNCGPGNSWRCSVIETAAAGHDFVFDGLISIVEMEIGPEASMPWLVYKTSNHADGVTDPSLRYARYVGANGNCGLEPSLGGPVARWYCAELMYSDQMTVPYLHYSFKVDSANRPTLAFSLANGSGGNVDLNLIYGIDMGTGNPFQWAFKKLDGKGIDTGYGIGLAIMPSGLGLAGFFELREYEPTLRLAYQEGFPAYLPEVLR